MVSGRLIATACACAMVSACGGGGGGDRDASTITSATPELGLTAMDSIETGLTEVERHEENLAEVDRLFEEHEGKTLTPSSDRITGQAEYGGIAGFDTSSSDGTEVSARLTLNADFDADTISGEISDFASGDEDLSVSGELAIANGRMVRDVDIGRFEADVNGNLTINDADRDVFGDMGGGFYGDNAETVLGYIDVDPIDGFSDDTIEGGFVAEETSR